MRNTQVSDSKIVKSNNSKMLAVLDKENGIVVPVILWWLGVPLTIVILLWFFVF